jgi:3',5'-cyclic AMP phosphodiesterase CpdA
VNKILLFSLGLCCFAQAQTPAASTWKFAVSGDSRNCGDIVMPAIASGVQQNSVDFYWHLGDFRALYGIDEDMEPPPQLGLPPKRLSVNAYLTSAWPDFIAHQMNPFGNTPVFLAIGNHETVLPATREAWLLQFADWLENPAIRAQRLKDNPQDHKLRTYYHWLNRNVDFITLDNATADQIDDAQLAWFRSAVQRDESSPEIRSIVVGMHIPLPGNVGHVHSMSDWAQGDKSGRQVYDALWHARSSAQKQVYILASHSHFVMENVFETADWKGRVLPGWIVGTAGAVRYRLPAETGPAQKAQTDVYGFLLGSVAQDGAVSFTYQKLSLENLMAANAGKQPESLVRWCYDENKQLQPLR